MNVNDNDVRFEEYDKAAISTDNKFCSEIGKDILKKDGSAVDAGIAAIFCVGVFHFQSTGIGGGGFMLVYERGKRKFTGFDFRESVPSKIDLKEFENDKRKTKKGELMIVL